MSRAQTENSRVVLGLHCGYSHDSGAALVVDGRIAAAVAEERVSRRKKDPYFPAGAIEKCLQRAGIAPADVGLVCMGAQDIQFIPAKEALSYFDGLGGYFTVEKPVSLRSIASILATRASYSLNRALDRRPFDSVLKSRLHAIGFSTSVPVQYVDHHDAHLASAYFTSGKIEARSGFIFVIDSYGDGKSVSVFRFRSDGPDFERVVAMDPGCSPGRMYSSVTGLLGMTPNRHEGKVTGLAGRGDPVVLYPATEKYLRYDRETKSFIVRALHENPIARLIRISRNLLGSRWTPGPYTRFLNEDFVGQSRENVAAAVQLRFDNEILGLFEDVIRDDQPEAILLAGGIFANVILNSKVAARFPRSEVLVHPGMTDEGIALGAALWGDWTRNGNCHRRVLSDVYLGPSYTARLEEFAEKLGSEGFRIERLTFQDSSGAEKVASLIASGRAVGIFHGGMEYGPRALGARSILADPRDPEINDKLNARMRRSEFMPFAPVVLEEHCDEVFDMPGNLRATSSFMTCVCQVREAWRGLVPAIVHVDGTARPQIISRTQNAEYYDVIAAFHRQTGIPLLINTSFNAHEEPIVENLMDACGALKDDVVDYVLAPPFLLSAENPSR